MAARTASISRKTNETQIEVAINLDCQAGSGNTQEISISTGIGFLDHVCHLLHFVQNLLSSHQDVPCFSETFGNVLDYEMQGGPMDR